MNKVLILSFSVLLFCTAAQGLMCRVCKMKVGNLCIRHLDACQARQGQFCETTDVYSGDILLYSHYGCGEKADLCNKTEERDSFFRMSYKRACCNTNLCN